jgi:hypothetical protein
VNVPGEGEDGFSMLEKSVTEQAEPIGEDSQASSRHQSCSISCADRDAAEEVEVESRADEERSSTHTMVAKYGDVEQHADKDGVGERQPQPPKEAARVAVERPANIDRVDEGRP